MSLTIILALAFGISFFDATMSIMSPRVNTFFIGVEDVDDNRVLVVLVCDFDGRRISFNDDGDGAMMDAGIIIFETCFWHIPVVLRRIEDRIIVFMFDLIQYQ